jgi:CheY-like chemotaxis protein
MKADAPRSQQPGADAILARSGVVGRGETVLVVEDEHRLRRITVGQLTALGFRVLEAGDGAAALEIMGKHPEVQVLYSDLVMPGGLSGLDLAKRVVERYPEVRVILTTGYSELTGEAGAELNLQVLRKPYRQAELVRVFQEALKARPAADHRPPKEGAPS